MPLTDPLRPFPHHSEFPNEDAHEAAIEKWVDEAAEHVRKRALDTLVGLFLSGPLYDGDVPSKAQRDELLACKLASRAIVCGEEGYQVLNYLGARVYRRLFPDGHPKSQRKTWRRFRSDGTAEPI